MIPDNLFGLNLRQGNSSTLSGIATMYRQCFCYSQYHYATGRRLPSHAQELLRKRGFEQFAHSATSGRPAPRQTCHLWGCSTLKPAARPIHTFRPFAVIAGLIRQRRQCAYHPSYRGRQREGRLWVAVGHCLAVAGANFRFLKCPLLKGELWRY